uniref:Uncharacterized protein n=1 Tax=Anguilla anguilla TaxID=7936 RepID=A0A0E9TN09_ANGAN
MRLESRLYIHSTSGEAAGKSRALFVKKADQISAGDLKLR